MKSDLELDRTRENLRAGCAHCFGLCCVGLYFAASDGFPIDKEAGQPCPNLQSDFRCSVHNNLWKQGLKGCISYDCFGAGQKVSQFSFKGRDWRQDQHIAKSMFEVFLIMEQLHELLWYLSEALQLKPAQPIHPELRVILKETEQLTELSFDSLLKLDIAEHRQAVNILLQKTSEHVRAGVRQGKKTWPKRPKTFGRGLDLIGADLRKTDLKGLNLRGAYLISADLRGVDLEGADLIGADLRDADIRGADLSDSIFLTQTQINSAIGDVCTKLPVSLTRPIYWGE
ncbi:MAG: pentapeptide repeat-containing protein [Peptococcaceae bacterium]|nr:pentapeptide repeat-containing protein [Peptococcaceae bacterium]